MNITNIDSSAPVSASHEITIQAPLKAVWDILTDIDNWSSWNPAITRSKLNAKCAVGATFDWKSGGVTIHSTLQQFEPMSRLVWTGRAIGTSAIHVWSLEETEAGVRVLTQESFSGWLVNLMPKAMQKTLDKALPAWLAHLKQAAEARAR